MVNKKERIRQQQPCTIKNVTQNSSGRNENLKLYRRRNKAENDKYVVNIEDIFSFSIFKKIIFDCSKIIIIYYRVYGTYTITCTTIRAHRMGGSNRNI